MRAGSGRLSPAPTQQGLWALLPVAAVAQRVPCLLLRRQFPLAPGGTSPQRLWLQCSGGAPSAVLRGTRRVSGLFGTWTLVMGELGLLRGPLRPPLPRAVAMGTLLSGSSDEHHSFLCSFIHSFIQQLFTESQKCASHCQAAGASKGIYELAEPLKRRPG